MNTYEIKIGDSTQVFTETRQGEVWTQLERLMKGQPEGVIPTVKSVPAPTVTATPVAAPIVRGETIDQAGRERAEADERAAREAGFAPARPLYATGTMVLDLGVQNAALSRKKWEELPDAREVLHDLASKIQSENRNTVKVQATELQMDDKGALVVPGLGKVDVPESVLPRLLDRAGLPGAGRYMAACNPYLRACNFNRWMKGQGSIGLFEGSEFQLRVRDGKDRPELYAAVGPKYPKGVDADTICRDLAQGLEPGARAQVVYDGFRLNADICWHSDVRPENYVAGEMFKAGMKFRSHDAGGGSIGGSSSLLRNLCLNLIILDSAEQEILNERHHGNTARIRAAIQGALVKGQKQIGHFLKAWDTARAIPLASVVKDVNNPARDMSGEDLTNLIWGAFVAAQKSKLIPVGKRDVPGLLKAFNKEPEPTKVGFVNAITRYAHEGQHNPFKADEIEIAAGALLQSTRPLYWQDPATA